MAKFPLFNVASNAIWPALLNPTRAKESAASVESKSGSPVAMTLSLTGSGPVKSPNRIAPVPSFNLAVKTIAPLSLIARGGGELSNSNAGVDLVSNTVVAAPPFNLTRR